MSQKGYETRLSRAAIQFVVVMLSVSAAASASAQLPFIPSPGQGPDVRFASADALLDDIRTLTTKVERIRDDRRPEIESLKNEINTELEASMASGAEVSPSDLARLHARLEALERERGLYEATRTLLQRAQEIVEVEPNPSPGPVTLDAQLELELEARRLAKAFSRQTGVAKRLEDLAAAEPETLAPDEASNDRLAEAESWIVRARAMHGAARALEARARARRASREAEVSSQRLEVDGDQVDAARAEFSRVEEAVQKEIATVNEQKAELAPISRAVPRNLERKDKERLRTLRREHRLAETKLLDRRGLTAESRRIRAATRLWALEQLAEDALEPTEVQAEAGRVVGRLALLDAQEGEARQELKVVREEERKLRPENALAKELSARRRVLKDALELMVEERQNLETAAVMTDIVSDRAEFAHRGVSRFWAALLSLLVLAVSVLLLRYGLRLISRLFSPEDEDQRLLVLSDQRARQFYTALTLLWPVTVAVTGAAVLAWPVWGLEATFLEALKAIDRPLFYVESAPVSVFSILKLLFALWLSVVLSRAVREVLSSRVYPQLQWDIGLTNALNTLAHYVVVGLGLIIGLRAVGVGFSSLAIFAGILGIGIGFGLRNITENFFSGLIILAERPIKIGDFIEVEGQVEGRVTRIRARSTTVVTRDNISVIIPNSEFVSKPVINWSHGDPKVRIPVDVGVVYGSDTDLVRKALLDVASRHGHVLKRPAPEVHFRSFGSSSLDFVLLVWVEEQLHRFRIASDLHFAIDKTFRKMEIEIAFPQMDLHLKTMSSGFSTSFHGPRLTDMSTAVAEDVPAALPEGRGRAGVSAAPARSSSGVIRAAPDEKGSA